MASAMLAVAHDHGAPHTMSDTGVERTRRYIEAKIAEAAPRSALTLDQLARVANMSPYHLQRRFKSVVGVSPAEYARMRRAERLRDELRSESSVSRAVYGAGYGSGSRVYETSRGAPLGMTPAAYRRGGEGVEIHFTVVDSAYGRLLVAATERGICAVTLGDDDAALEKALRSEFKRAKIERVDEGADEWLSGIVERVTDALRSGNDAKAMAAVPLDVQGTAFQWRVWRALQEIPVGETRSYSEIANQLGRPTAARAVARACGSNRVAVVIPCHRVVREDGSLGGYRWGIERKVQLLDEERAAVTSKR